ncbi:Small-conductance mechanosensitive channel [Luteitalea pratensis]|uniref:Small-conductance mechanosensitive channel n=1 Tax=Luteitalea pratensis TaxID=1855912 RepID=A0A143PVD1_LUTPR|nr:mechanosensitive ion channel domain-containing protein [Luteitalea pratensis]AMY12123.1 Small-conductance mechanosensitive channel [Luteitalea pratensis]
MNQLLADLGARWMWALALVLAFPAALLALNELAFDLVRRGRPIATSVRFVRTWVLSALVFVLFLRNVLDLPGEHLWVRLALTLFWVCVVLAVLGAINTVVFEQASQGSWQSRVPKLLRDLVRLLLVATAGALVFSFVWGRELSGALAALGVTSIVVGLALQEPLGNLFSGLMLLMERPFEVGDNVEVAGASGVVKEINWRSAHIKSARGVVQIVPNSTLNKEIINNYSRPRPVRMEEIEVAFSYDDPPNLVRDSLLEVAQGTPGVMQDPAPIAATFAYTPSAISYKLIYRTTEDDRWPVRNDVVTRIWYVAKRRGLTMPYPVVRQINYDAEGPFVPPVVPPVEQLRRLSKVSTLSDDEGQVRALTFGRDEVIFSEGSELSGVYLLISGAVSLEVGADGVYSPIGAVAAGEYFGEAGMYGVQPAEMRAVASLDCAVLWMSPETVRTLFEASPRLARETGQILEARRRAMQAARQLTRRG